MKTALFLLYNTYKIQSHRAKTQKLKKQNKKKTNKNNKPESQSSWKNRLRIDDKVT